MRIHVGKLTESKSGLKGFTAKHALISYPAGASPRADFFPQYCHHSLK